jgi:hypothetical protein
VIDRASDNLFGYVVSGIVAKQRVTREATFGELTHVAGNMWKRALQLNIFGQNWTISLSVDIDPKGGVEQNQVHAFAAFNSKTAAITAAAEKAIFQHYQTVCSEYRSRYGIRDPSDERVPLIKSVKDLYRLVEPESVTFPYVCPRPTFGILCQCTWEEEHGLAVKYEDGKVVEVGFQDIVL